MSDCVREMTEIERNEYLINVMENVSCPVLLYQWEKDLVKSALKSQISFLTYARNIGYQPTMEALNNIPPNTGSSVQNKSYQSNMIDSSTRTKFAKLAEYEALEEKCGYNIAEAIHGLSGEILRLKDELAEYKDVEERLKVEYGSNADIEMVVDLLFKTIEKQDGEPLKGFRILTNKDALLYDEWKKQLQPPYITDEEFVNYTEGTNNVD